MIKGTAEGIMIDRKGLSELSDLVERNHRDVAVICTRVIITRDKVSETLEVGREYTLARTGVVEYLTDIPIPLLVKDEGKQGEAVVKHVGRSATGGTYVRFEVKSLNGDGQ